MQTSCRRSRSPRCLTTTPRLGPIVCPRRHPPLPGSRYVPKPGGDLMGTLESLDALLGHASAQRATMGSALLRMVGDGEVCTHEEGNRV